MTTTNKIRLSVYLYRGRAAKCYVAYCPSLNLCGYDRTATAAKKDFLYVLREYWKDMEESGELVEDLKRHGWRETENGMAAPTFSTMYREKGSVLRDILSDDDLNYQRYNVPCSIMP